MQQDIVLVNTDAITLAQNSNAGLASLESYLNHNGVRCVTIREEEIGSYVDTSQVFGFSVLDHTYVTARKLTEKLRGKKVVWGGWTATALPEFILEENPGVDYVVLQEGERRLLRLLKSFQAPEKFHEIDGIAFRDDRARIVVRPPTEFMDMNELHVPTELAVLGDLVFVELSRGCYGKCAYCQEVRKMRFKSAQKAAGEIQYWTRKGYRDFYIGGANSIANGRLLREFVAELEQMDLRVGLFLVGRPDDVLRNYSVLERISRSETIRLIAVEMGIEAITQHALDLIGRGITPEVNREAIDALIRLKEKHSPSTAIIANMILFPHFDMTMDDFIENARLIGAYRFSRNTLAPYLFGLANTPVWHDMKRRGFRVQKEYGLKIMGYPFSDREVDRLFRKLIWAPLRECTQSAPSVNFFEAMHQYHDQVVSFYDSGDIEKAVTEFINS